VADSESPFSTATVKNEAANVLKPRTTVLLTCLHLNGVMNGEAVQRCTVCDKPILSVRKQTLLVEYDVEQRAVNFQPAVVVDEAHLSEPIHEEVNAGASRTDHFRQSFLAYFRNHVL
jgi:hypothetical protein